MTQRSRSRSKHTIGDRPIEDALQESMVELGRYIDRWLNVEGKRDIGFCLMVFPMGAEGRCNYLSNANRLDMIVLLKEQLARFEGQPEMQGTA